VAARWPATQPVVVTAERGGGVVAGAHAGPAIDGGPGSASLPTLTVIDPDDERNGLFNIGYYENAATAAAGWTRDRDKNGRARLYRNASYNRQTLYVGYSPRLSGRGLYTIEVFVPANHAYSRDAHYFIVDYARVRRECWRAGQSPHYDEWVPLRAALVNGAPADPPLSQFALDPAFSDSGRVNVADITFVDPATHASGRFEISFGAIRWRPYTPPAVTPPPPASVGFDSPVGTPAERAGVFADGRKLFDHTCGAALVRRQPIGSRYWLGDRWAVYAGGDLSGPGVQPTRMRRCAPWPTGN
jgi:hypothetical protein